MVKNNVVTLIVFFLTLTYACKTTTVEPGDHPRPARDPSGDGSNSQIPDGEGNKEENCLLTTEPARLQWPVPSQRQVMQKYGADIEYQDCHFHTGIDVEAPEGTPIVAAESGQVLHVGPMWFSAAGKGRGPNAIIIEHVGSHYYTTYSHNRRALVNPGQCVKKGQVIAEVGNLGYSTGPHLHFEIVKDRIFTRNWQTPFYNLCVIGKPYDAGNGYKSPNLQDITYDY